MRNYQPLISVIMPVYNCVNYIDEAIESIIKQTYMNLEIFIIDDCSLDGTREKITHWVKLDSRIIPIFKSENTGYVRSLNEAIEKSKGEFIARMDGDDICELSRFEIQVKYLLNNRSVICVGTFGKIIGTNTVLKKPVKNEDCRIRLLSGTPFIHPSVMFRRKEIVENALFYNIEKEPAEDYDFFIGLSQIGELHNIDQILIRYRVHDKSVSHVRHKSQLHKKRECRRRYIELLGVNQRVIEIEFSSNSKLRDLIITWNKILWKNLFFSKLNMRLLFTESLRLRINSINKYLLEFKSNRNYYLYYYLLYLKLLRKIISICT